MIIITFDKRGTISLFTKQIIASCLQDGIWYVHHQQTVVLTYESFTDYKVIYCYLLLS